MNKFHDLLKPKIFMNISKRFLGLYMFMGLILLISSFYLGIFVTETDFKQGENFRILYIHVTSAWLSLMLYGMVALFSLIFLINTHVFFYYIAKTNAIIGINVTVVTLISGSLWGRPTWGSFWVWDARLTSVFILFLLYLAYFIIDNIHEIKMKAMNNSSILAVLGFINIPIIKYSVHWWNTLHQSSSVTQNYISLDISIYTPLLLCFLGMISYIISLIFLEMRKHMILRKIETYYL